MEHTPTPWYCDGDGIYSNADCEGAPLAHVLTMGYDNDFRNIDARRIVACINACSHIPTDRLEMAMPGQMKSSLDGLCDSVERLTAQRDELLAVLESIIDLHDSASRGKQVAETIGKARAVIQKVRGGE